MLGTERMLGTSSGYSLGAFISEEFLSLLGPGSVLTATEVPGT